MTAPEQSHASMFAYYRERAGEYEQVYQKPERQGELAQLHARIRARFIRRKTLEIASGTGYWTQTLAESAASVLALDFTEETLDLALAKNLPTDRVTFIRADSYRLPVKEGSFDAALAMFWLSHVPLARAPEFFAGLHHSLRRPAIVLLADNLFVPGNSSPISRRDAEGNTYQQRRLNNGAAFEIVKNFPSKEDLLRLPPRGARNVRAEFGQYYWTLEYELT